MSDASNPISLLDYDQVTARVTLSESRVRQLVRAGKFPCPVPLGGRRLAFVEHEVSAWINERVAERDRAASA